MVSSLFATSFLWGPMSIPPREPLVLAQPTAHRASDGRFISPWMDFWVFPAPFFISFLALPGSASPVLLPFISQGLGHRCPQGSAASAFPTVWLGCCIRPAPGVRAAGWHQRLQWGQRSQAAGNACHSRRRPGRGICTGALQPAALSIPATCATPPHCPALCLRPRRATWRMSDSHSLCNPPRCQVKVFEVGGGGWLLTHFLSHILQLNICFTIYENLKRTACRCLFLYAFWSWSVVCKSVFQQLTRSYRNRFLLTVFWNTSMSW